MANCESYLPGRDTIAADSESYSPGRDTEAANSESYSPIRDTEAANSESYSPVRANSESYQPIEDAVAVFSQAVVTTACFGRKVIIGHPQKLIFKFSNALKFDFQEKTRARDNYWLIREIFSYKKYHRG